MPSSKKIEDYGVIGDMQTAALVDRNASIEWLCLPRFDSDACFAALLGGRENGYWQISPSGEIRSQSRRYCGETLILETLFETATGSVAVIDFMPLKRKEHQGEVNDLVRIVEGREGRVEMCSEALFRFDYGRVAPWIKACPKGIHAIVGSDGLCLDTPVELHSVNNTISATFTVDKGARVPFVLTWYRSYHEVPASRDAEQALRETQRWWCQWSSRCRVSDEYREPVVRSLITLKALTHIETGGMVGAASCSLPERIGDQLNWDYRYTWLRDATFTLYALLASGYKEEAIAWRQWLLRAAAGDPGMLQPLYGIGGERRVDEYEIDWLTGFANSRPVRIGNGAYRQRQLDVYGEVMDGLYVGRTHDIEPNDDIWSVQRRLVDYLMAHWQEKDAGLWESRGPEEHYTHSKVMCWVAMDRAIKAVENYNLDGEVERWRELRQKIHDDVCINGFSAQRNSFVQYYAGDTLDAALLLIPQMGFLPIDDPRIVGTIEAIQRELIHGGFVYRFAGGDSDTQSLVEGEGAFLVCGFWLVDALVMLERDDEARELFDRLLGVRNDLGLLAEEYDPVQKRQLGNFPQAFSHVGLINSAHNLSQGAKGRSGPAQKRAYCNL